MNGPTVVGHSLSIGPKNESYSATRSHQTEELIQANNNNNSYTGNANLAALNGHHLQSNGITTGYGGTTTDGPAEVVRETKTVQKTEVLHVDTHSEPIA